MADRALLFIDGYNWYHALRDAGHTDIGRLNYALISRKLVGPRECMGTRYYIGQVRQEGITQLYADQRRFLAILSASDSRISAHLGRLEPRTTTNPAAEELATYLGNLQTRIDVAVYKTGRSREATPET